MIDRRRFPSNGRVAHDSLKDKVEGVSFVSGLEKQIIEPVVGLHKEPNGPMDRQLVYGDRFLELDQDHNTGFSFGQMLSDQYVGYVKTHALGNIGPTTHKVRALNAHIYPKANIKTVPVMTIPLGAKLNVMDNENGFVQLSSGGFVPVQAVTLIADYEHDPIDVAKKFLNVAYLWGGDSYCGIDCSGLIQAAFSGCGIFSPRDSDMQEKELGSLLPDDAVLQTNDLVFWPGHVGMMIDAQNIIHANAHHMRVTIEPLTKVSNRILKAEGKKISSIKRIV